MGVNVGRHGTILAFATNPVSRGGHFDSWLLFNTPRMRDAQVLPQKGGEEDLRML